MENHHTRKWMFAERQDGCIVSKYLPIRSLLLTKRNIVPFQWRNLANCILLE